MSSVWLIFRKEWKGLFASPIIYVVMAVFCALMGYMFFGLITQFQMMSMQYERFGGMAVSLNEAVVAPLYGNAAVLWLIILPLVTMRLVSEERKEGTFVLLLTAPVTLAQIVLGKFFAGLGFVACLLAITAVYPLVCVVYGNAQVGPIFSGMIGMLAMGGIFVALGLFASSLTRSPLLSAVLGFAFILFFWIVDFLSELGSALKFLQEMSLLSHLDAFMKGVMDTYHIAFYGIFLAVVLYLAHQALQSERWR